MTYSNVVVVNVVQIINSVQMINSPTVRFSIVSGLRDKLEAFIVDHPILRETSPAAKLPATYTTIWDKSREVRNSWLLAVGNECTVAEIHSKLFPLLNNSAYADLLVSIINPSEKN